MTVGRSEEAKTQSEGEEEEWEEKGVRERGCVPRDTFFRGPRESWSWGGREGEDAYPCECQGVGGELTVTEADEEVMMVVLEGGEEDGASLGREGGMEGEREVKAFLFLDQSLIQVRPPSLPPSLPPFFPPSLPACRRLAHNGADLPEWGGRGDARTCRSTCPRPPERRRRGLRGGGREG